MADNFPRTLAHLNSRNTSFVMVSRAPLSKIETFKSRMGWVMPWYSSFETEFNYDFHVTMDESVAPVQYNVSVSFLPDLLWFLFLVKSLSLTYPLV